MSNAMRHWKKYIKFNTLNANTPVIKVLGKQ